MKPTAWSKFSGGGGDKNITINHGFGGGDCGGSGNIDGNRDGVGGDGGGGDGGGMMTAMSDNNNNDDDDDDDDDNGYDNDGRQQWRRLPAPVPIDGAL
jgi:hypothetical protein